MKFLLRRPEAGDEQVVGSWLRDYLVDHLNWWHEAYGRAPERSLSELVAEDWQALLEDGASDDAFVRVLVDPGPLGVVRARKQRDRYMGFDVGVLSWIFVDPSARGSGASGVLMEAADEWMATQGVGGRMVYVTASNGAAVDLYGRFGYRVIDYRMLAPAP